MGWNHQPVDSCWVFWGNGSHFFLGEKRGGNPKSCLTNLKETSDAGNPLQKFAWVSSVSTKNKYFWKPGIRLVVYVLLDLFAKSNLVQNLTSDGWWFRNPANQLRLVVEIPFFTRVSIYARWVVGRISEPSTVLSLPKIHTPSLVNVSWGLQAELNCDNDVVPVRPAQRIPWSRGASYQNYVAEIGLNNNALLRDGTVVQKPFF